MSNTIHIKRRYENQEYVTAKGSSAVRFSADAKVGSLAVSIKLSKATEDRIVSLKELAYRTFRASKLLNVYFEFEPRIKRIALDGGSKYDQLAMSLKYGLSYPKDLQTAVDLVTK